MIETFEVEVKLENLIFKDAPATSIKAHPYLWVIFFKIDGEGVKVSNEFRLKGKAIFKFSEGSHQNLGVVLTKPKDIIAIPPSIGEWATHLQPLHLPFFEQKTPASMGIIAVLMDENNVSSAGAEAGHQALNEEIIKAINTAVEGFLPTAIDIDDIEGSIKNYFIQQVEPQTSVIPQRIANAIQKKQSILQNLWSLVNKDEFIGFQSWTFSQREILNAGGKIALQCDWEHKSVGSWQINGFIQIKNKHA